MAQLAIDMDYDFDGTRPEEMIPLDDFKSLRGGPSSVISPAYDIWGNPIGELITWGLSSEEGECPAAERAAVEPYLDPENDEFSQDSNFFGFRVVRNRR
jgi:hypothetical protein